MVFYNIFYTRTENVDRLPLNQWGILFTAALDRAYPGWRARQGRKGLYPFVVKPIFGPSIAGMPTKCDDGGERPYQRATEEMRKMEEDLIGYCVQLTHTINGTTNALPSTSEEVDWAKRKARLLLTTSNFVFPLVDEVKAYIHSQFRSELLSKEIPNDRDHTEKLKMQAEGPADPQGRGASGFETA